jgi:hypothetical protein
MRSMKRQSAKADDPYERMQRLRSAVTKYESTIRDLDTLTRQIVVDIRKERDSRDVSDDCFRIVQEFAEFWDGSLTGDLGDWVRNVVESLLSFRSIVGVVSDDD